MAFSDVVDRVMRENGLTLQKFVDEFNPIFADPRDRVTRMTVSNWRRGIWRPPLSQIDYLARYAPVGSWTKKLGYEGVNALQCTHNDAAMQLPQVGDVQGIRGGE